MLILSVCRIFELTSGLRYKLLLIHARHNGLHIVFMNIVFKIFLNSSCTIAFFFIIKDSSNFTIKLLTLLLALSNLMTILNSIIKPISRNPKHLSHTDNFISHQVFEYKLIAICLRFFAK